MARRRMAWKVVAGIFTVGNVLGAAYAAVLGEQMHAGVHVILTLLGAYWMWWLQAPTAPQEMPSMAPGDERIEQLQQSVDAVALEVERIGEAQRWNEKLQKERVEKQG